MRTAKLLLDRFGKAYIFLYRYPKGMRTIGAFQVALTDMSWRVFTALNFASTITWTFAMVGVGYLSGAALDELIGDNWGVFSVDLLSIFFLLTYLAWRQVNAVAVEEAQKKVAKSL